MADLPLLESIRPRHDVTPDTRRLVALHVAWCVRDKTAARELLDMLDLRPKETRD